jgi:glutamyl-Q tRNA(Asp) synthetase
MKWPESKHTRRGRFAPSPTGPLHLGSLATALASWLDARAQSYAWLVRMEDLDPQRQAAGAADLILAQLSAHGLVWQASVSPPARTNGVLYQSDRNAAYQTALLQLLTQGRAFACTCSRKKLQQAADSGLAQQNADGEVLYPGFCRDAQIDPGRPDVAIRFRSDAGDDDFVIRRADGFWAYHLAVVVDDAFQGITDIVRGDDLLLAAPRHDALRLALGLSSPRLIHVPVIRNRDGEKLSKQTRAPAVRIDSPHAVAQQLQAAWQHLQTQMPEAWVKQVRLSLPEQITAQMPTQIPAG